MKNQFIFVALFAICSAGSFWSGTARSCVICGSGALPSCATIGTDGHLTCVVNDHYCSGEGDCKMAGCFLPGTLVQTPDGPRALEDVQVGDMVLGVDDNGNSVFNEVVNTIRAVAVSYYVINDEIQVTGIHPFRVDESWVPAEELRLGDVLVGTDGTPTVVESIATVDFGVRTFNLSVSGNHTFFADGVLVHNKEDDPGEY